ncbi:MAG: DUF885 domain-containing protein [Woeseiaceae bacterium]
MPTARILTCILALILAACSGKPAESDSASVTDQINRIADEFVDGYYAQYPEKAYEFGYPSSPMDRFGDQSEESVVAWNAEVDSWLAELDSIDLDSVADAATARTYVFTRDRLQAIIDERICRMDLWDISSTWTGWPYMFASTFAVQPVATEQDRQDALARLADVARYLEVKTGSLQHGQDLGYTAGQNNVDAVIEKVTSIIETPTVDSPFYVPATGSDDEEFVAAYKVLLETTVTPAMTAYRDYLANDYQGHDGPGVGANPNGEACYAASVRYHTSISMDAEAIHRVGLSEMSRIQSEMLEIARETFGTDDLKGLLEELRSNPDYTFRDEQHMLDYLEAAVARGKAAVGDWFGYVPDAEMIIVASPPFDKDSGGGFYSAGAADGSRPGIYTAGTYEPTSISQAGQEATAFHESYPGHHMQSAVTMSDESAHSISRFFFVSGTGEGWGFYTERLADEMGLYSDELARLGMLGEQALRAARLVVDPGIHVMGWSRDEAIQYMMDHTTNNEVAASGEIDRYSAVPGQATSYMLGSMEIQRLRRLAEDTLGDDFDIREFHDRVIANGNVTLPMMGAAVESWIRNTQEQNAK